MGLLMADTCLLDVATLLFGGALLLYWWSVSTFSYWKHRGVKTIKEVTPFLGSIAKPFLLKRQMALHFQDMYKELEGERFGGYYKMRSPAIMVRDPILIREIMQNEFSSFQNNDFPVSEKNDPMLAYNIFTMKGDRWKYTRSKLTNAYTSGKIRSMVPLMKVVCSQLKESLQHKIGSENGEFDAKVLSANYTTDMVATCAFGMTCNSLNNDDNEFRIMGKQIVDPSPMRALATMVIMLFPDLASFLGLKFIPDTLANFFRGLVEQAITFRIKNNVTRSDFIQLLIQLKEKSKEEAAAAANGKEQEKGRIEFTHDVLTAQAVGFFIDGFETSSSAMAFALHELAVNRDVQERLRENIDEVLALHKGELTCEALSEMTYLDMVLQEALRKYVPVGAFSRLCTRRYKIPDSDVYVEEGMSVAIPVYGIHHDPQFYPDPQEFQPDRFSEENKKLRQPFTFMPFGEGPRMCIGMKFATMQVKLALATIIRDFEVVRSAKTKDPLEFDPNFFLLMAKGGLPVRVLPRNKT